MAADEILRSYGDQSVKEDVLNMIENLSPTEDSLFKTLGKSKAYDVVHSWLVDSLDNNAAAANEYAAFSALESSTPTRSTNVVEVINKDFAVTDTQRAISHYGMADQYAYQQMKAMKDWRNKAESEILRGSLVSGISGTTPQLAGILNCISTNVTAQTSGTVFNQSNLDGLLALAWENGNGEGVTDIYVGAALKGRISQFSGRSGSQFLIQQNEKSLVSTTDYYTSDFGNLQVHLHRYINSNVSGTADATGRVLGIARSKFKIAYLIDPKVVPMAKRGSSTDARVTGSITVESLNEPTSFFASGYKKSL